MIFICSPYAGDTLNNIRRAQNYSRAAAGQGVTPIAPHLLFPQFLHDNVPAGRATGIRMGMELLDLCSEVWVFGDPTPGMKEEIHYAQEHNIPIRFFPAEDTDQTRSTT